MMSSGNWQRASDWTYLNQKHSIKFERTLSHWFLYFESWAQGQREIISIHPLGLKVLKPNLDTWKLNKSIKIIAGQAHNSGGYEFIQMRALVRMGMGGCWMSRRSASSSSCPNCDLLFKNPKKRHPRGQCVCDWLLWAACKPGMKEIRHPQTCFTFKFSCVPMDDGSLTRDYINTHPQNV